MIVPNATDSTKSLLLDCIRDKIRLKDYSIKTETAYVDWVRRFVLFHHLRHPSPLSLARGHVSDEITRTRRSGGRSLGRSRVIGGRGNCLVPSLARVPANGRTANESRSRGQRA